MQQLTGDEGPYLPNCETYLVIVLHALVSIVLIFHKHNNLPLGRFEPSYPSTK